MNWFLSFGIVLLVLITISGCASINAERRAPPIGDFIDVKGRQVHLVDMGSKSSALSPIVFVHGASTNLRDMQIAFGNSDFDNRRVIMVDRAGHGYSDRPSNGHELKVQAQQIHDAISAIGVQNPIVVGQSFGGAVALAYALEFQSEMAGLVLLAPVSHEWPGGIAWYNSVSQTPGLGFLLRRFVIPVYGQFAADKSVQGAFVPGMPPENYASQVGLSLLFRPKEFRSNAADIYHLKNQVMAMQDKYNQLDLPVHVVAGEVDKAVSPELHAKVLGREIPGAELTLLPNTGHTLHHAETEQIVSIIKAIGTARLEFAE